MAGSDDPLGARLDRRTLLRAGGALALGGALNAVACGPAPAPAAPAATSLAVQPTVHPPVASPTVAVAAVRPTRRSLAAPTEAELRGIWAGPLGRTMAGLLARHNARVQDNLSATYAAQPAPALISGLRSPTAGKGRPHVVGVQRRDLGGLVAADLLREWDVQTLSDAGIDAADFAPPLWDEIAIGGKRYALPLDVSPLALYVNLSITSKLGLDLEADPPTTRQKFIDYARALTEIGSDGGVTRSGFPVAHDSWSTFALWWTVLHQNGGRFLKKDSAGVAFNSPEGIDAAQFVQDLVHVHRVTAVGVTDPDRDFIAGGAAMHLSGPWWIPGFSNPNGGPRFAVVEAPLLGSTRAVWSGGGVLAVPKDDDPNRGLAASLLAGWVSASSGVGGWAETGLLPARASLRIGLSSLPHRQAFLKALAYAVPEPHYLPRGRELFTFSRSSPLSEAMRTLVSAEPRKPAQVIAEMASAVARVLESPGS